MYYSILDFVTYAFVMISHMVLMFGMLSFLFTDYEVLACFPMIKHTSSGWSQNVDHQNQLGGQRCTMHMLDVLENKNEVLNDYIKRGNSSSLLLSMKFPHPCGGFCKDMFA